MSALRRSGESWSLAVVLLVAGCAADGASTTLRSPFPAAVGGSPAVAGSGSTLPPSPTPTPTPAGSIAPPPVVPVAGSGASEPAPSDPDNCAAITQSAQNERQPADIVFAVDNSGSMNDEMVFVREQLNTFSQQIIASGIDVRIILISAPYDATGGFLGLGDNNGICIAPPLGSGSCPYDSKAPHYVHVAEKVGSHDALDLFIETYPRWQAHLRPQATKTFVVVSDDDATFDEDDAPGATSASEAFAQRVKSLPGGMFERWSFSGIYPFSDCDDAADIGTTYDALVDMTEGVRGDLCLQSFAPVFDTLAKAVIQSSGLECSWQIPPVPVGQTFDRERVNVQYSLQSSVPQPLLRVSSPSACAADGGWYYDDQAAPQRIEVCPSTCSAVQTAEAAKVDVLFGCETAAAPE
ncbi:MAG: hypothetical protein ABW321_35840 [Polyangiales bacterium]